MNNDKKAHARYQIHRLPKGIRKIHQDYGLWIIGGGGGGAPVNSFNICPPRYFEFFSISHMHEGAGFLRLEPDRDFDVRPGNCIIISPQTVNRYGGVNGQAYIEDNLTFTGPVAEMLFRSGIIKAGVFEMGKARRLLPIQRMAADPSVDSQINANIALQRLLVDIYYENRKMKAAADTSAQVIGQLLELIKEQLERWWTVEEMAEYCGLGKDQFRRNFKKVTGMLPKVYLDRLKLQKAAELLISSHDNVAEIAERLGYLDPYHFSRRFKTVIGFSPRRYRSAFAFR